MTYSELTRFATSIPAGDHQTARQFLIELAATLKSEPLKPHQRRYLYRLRNMWKERAEGRDARWEIFGCRPGAPKKAKESMSGVVDAADPGVVADPDRCEPPVTERLNAQPEVPVVPPAPPKRPSPLADLLKKY